MMTDTWTWATVTQATPLRIKVDGDTAALDATTGDLVGSLAVDDRVRVHLHADGIIVTGLQGGAGGGGGGTAEATAATANTLALRDGDGRTQFADPAAAQDAATKASSEAAADAAQTAAELFAGYEANEAQSAAESFATSADSALGATAATPNTLALRDASGRAQFSPPVDTEDAATKGYVDANSGGSPEATGPTPNTLAQRDGSGQLKAADGVADDDVVTVGQLSVAASLPDAVDLDDYTTPGLWHQDANARAATGTNYPAPYAGLLEVFNGAQSGTFVYQRYTGYKDHQEVWLRSYYSGWGPWNLIGGEDTGWVDATVLSGFAANSTHERPQVRKKNGLVLSKGVFANTGMSANGNYTVGTLPTGFSPPVNVITGAGTSTGASTASLFFTSGGSILIRTNSTLSGYYGIGGNTWTTD